jgi:formiminoglutamase
MQSFNDVNWPRASEWLSGQTKGEIKGLLGLIGAPVRQGSITPGRCDLAPAAVRSIMRKFSVYDIESESDLRTLEVVDRGDLPLAEATLEQAFDPISQAVTSLLNANAGAVVILGGDNGVTRPGLHGLAGAAVASSLDRCGLVTFDAHFDLRDLDHGLSNGNPIRALLADGLPGRNIAQIGLQSFANSQRYAEIACEAGIAYITMNQVREQNFEALINNTLGRLSSRVDAIYVDFDIDVLDRIFAPATPGSRPGGLTPWELRRAAWICGYHPKVRAIDLVEVDPTQDIADATVLATAQCLLSFASGLVSRLSV